MEPNLTVVTVPLSFVEYRLAFSDSLLSEWSQNGRIVNALLRALSPWNVQLSAVSIKGATANLGEVQITFELIPQRAAFHLFLNAATLLWTNLSSVEVPILIRMVAAIKLALAESTNVDIANQQVTFAMHLTPQQKNIREITFRFCPFSDINQDDESVKAFGFSIYRDTGLCAVERSLLYDNALFIRLVHIFDKARLLEDIASTIQSEQADLLQRLELTLG